MTEDRPSVPGQEPQPPRDRYTRPQLFPEQEEFGPTQEPLIEDDREYVLGSFERTVDILRDNAESTGVLEVDYPEPGRVANTFWATGDDDRRVSVTILKEATKGTVIRRSLAIYWDEDMIGSTTYEASYISETPPRVTRDDDTGMLSPGSTDIKQGFKAKLEAEQAQEEYGFNRGSVGRREINGLQGYMHIPPQRR